MWEKPTQQTQPIQNLIHLIHFFKLAASYWFLGLYYQLLANHIFLPWLFERTLFLSFIANIDYIINYWLLAPALLELISATWIHVASHSMYHHPTQSEDECIIHKEKRNDSPLKFFDNSIVGEGGIWTLDVFIKNTKKCQPIELQGSWRLTTQIVNGNFRYPPDTAKTAPKSLAKWHNRTAPQVIVHHTAPSLYINIFIYF